MPNELFAELETKLVTLIDEVENLRLEISDLRQTRDTLLAEQQQTEQSLQRLLGKFERLADSADL